MTSKNQNNHIFIVDGMLKGLARWLRFLGFNTIITEDTNEAIELLKADPAVIFLTGSPEHNGMMQSDRSYLLRSDSNRNQLHELNHLFQIFSSINILSRCSICNSKLIDVSRESTREKIPEKVYQSFTVFRKCPVCDRIYWNGGHVQRLMSKLRRMDVPVEEHSFEH